MRAYINKFSLVILLVGLAFFSACRPSAGDDTEPKTEKPPGWNETSQKIEESKPIQALSAQIKENPDQAELYFMRANMYLQSNLLEKAAIDYADAILKDSTNATYYLAMADFYFQEKKLPLSINILEKGKNLVGENPNVQIELGKYYFYLKEYEKAEENLEAVYKRFPDNGEVLFWMGMMSRDLEKPSEALTYFEKAVEADPDHYNSNMILGQMYSAKKDKRAVQAFERAFTLNPTSLEALYSKAMFYQNNSEEDKALEVYKSIIAQDMQYLDAHYNTGYIYFQRGQYEKALKNFNIALSVSPAFAKGYFMRGACAENLGNIDAAIEDYKKAVNFDPKLKSGLEALARLKKES